MGEIIVIRVGSSGVTVSPSTPLDSELVDRVKMIARASRRLARLWGPPDSKVTLEWSSGRAVIRVGGEDLLAILVYNRKPFMDNLRGELGFNIP